MKITRGGLRRMIMSEVKRLREAAGEERDLTSDPGGYPDNMESEAASMDQSFDDGDELTQACAGAAAEEFKRMNEYDPSADSGELGQSAWDEQLEAAADALTEELVQAIQPIVIDAAARLHDGEFYRGR